MTGLTIVSPARIMADPFLSSGVDQEVSASASGASSAWRPIFTRRNGGSRGRRPYGRHESQVGVARSDDAGLVGEHDRLDAVAEAELHQDARDVRLHRRLRDEERLRDLGVREAARDQAEHLELARGQVLQPRELRLRASARCP